jgi:hypothetical protein
MLSNLQHFYRTAAGWPSFLIDQNASLYFGITRRIVTQVKSFTKAHEHTLARHSKFSQVVLACESFLLFLLEDFTVRFESAPPPSTPADDDTQIHFTPQTLEILDSHFVALATVVAKIKKVEVYQKENYEDELDFEMQRITRG